MSLAAHVPATRFSRPACLLAIGFVSIALFATSARSDWLEASSDHFVIYADQSEAGLRRFAERLEQFHSAMALRFGLQEVKPSPSNRVTVFVVSNQKKVRRLGNFNNRYVAGFYRPRAGATVAVVPRLQRSSSAFELSPETILYHEYAHHFMYHLTARVFPRWFVEGFAEFFASVRFEADGGVGLGAPATHRFADLVYSREVPIRTLLEFDGGASSAKTVYDAFYGQSWLLFHYLMFEPGRSGQIKQYQELLGAGKPALDAALGAFGDLDRLESDLERYQKRTKLNYMVYSGSALRIGPVSIRELRPGESEMITTRMESRVGVTEEEAKELLPDARRVAGRYTEDPAVLAALAKAELDAGNVDAAIAAADQALAIDSEQIDAHIQKGLALFRLAEQAESPGASWQEVRDQFVRANKVENDNPIPLFQYYLTYLEQGQRPPKVAVDGLVWAMALAPYDPSLRWVVAQQMIADDHLGEAARVLAPLAYSPHPGELTARALQLLNEVQARAADEPVRNGD